MSSSGKVKRKFQEFQETSGRDPKPGSTTAVWDALVAGKKFLANRIVVENEEDIDREEAREFVEVSRS